MVSDPNDACCKKVHCDWQTATTVAPFYIRTTPPTGGGKKSKDLQNTGSVPIETNI